VDLIILSCAMMSFQVDQPRVDAAIEKGIQHLQTAPGALLLIPKESP